MASKDWLSLILISIRDIGKFLTIGGRLNFPRAILRRAFRFLNCEVTITDFDGKFYARLRLNEHMQRRIFWMDFYSRDVVFLIKKEIKPGMVFIDVGANIGEITMVAAACVGSTGKVVAFEPVSAIATRLIEHVQINSLSQVVVRREALGNKEGRLPIFASCGQSVPDEHVGLASLYGGNDNKEWIEHVDVVTLDSIANSLALQRVDLIKIDIEGGELACLQGAENVLRRFKPKLIVEVQEFSAQQAGWNVEELFRYLRGLDYEFFTIGAGGDLKELEISSLPSFQNVFCRVRV